MIQSIGNSLRIKKFLDEKGSQTLNALAPSKARWVQSSDLLNYFHGKLLIPTEFRKILNIYIYENLNNWMVWVGLSPLLSMILNLLHQTSLRGRWNSMGQKIRTEMWFCYLVPILTGHEPSDSPPWHNPAPQCFLHRHTCSRGKWAGPAEENRHQSQAAWLLYPAH